MKRDIVTIVFETQDEVDATISGLIRIRNMRFQRFGPDCELGQGAANVLAALKKGLGGSFPKRRQLTDHEAILARRKSMRAIASNQPTSTDEGHRIAYKAQDGEGTPILGVYGEDQPGPEVKLDSEVYTFRGVDEHSGLHTYGLEG